MLARSATFNALIINCMEFDKSFPGKVWTKNEEESRRGRGEGADVGSSSDGEVGWTLDTSPSQSPTYFEVSGQFHGSEKRKKLIR